MTRVGGNRLVNIIEHHGAELVDWPLSQGSMANCSACALVLCDADGPPPFDVPPGRQIVRKVKALTPAVAGKAV
jgi:hypothetical protein